MPVKMPVPDVTSPPVSPPVSPSIPDTSPPEESDSAAPPESVSGQAPEELVSKVDPLEEWWLEPQTFTYQGEPEYMAEEKYTVVWWGRGLTSPERIRNEISKDIDRYHALGIRYIVPISILDIEDSADLSVIREVSAEMMAATVLKLDGSPLVLIEGFGGDPEATQYAYDINHPEWRDYVLEQALAAVDAGADAISIDDADGNVQWVRSGLGSFNPASEAGFRQYLKDKYSLDELGELGISDIDSFDYSDFLTGKGWTVATLRLDSYPGHADFPLYHDFWDFQARAMAEAINFIMETARQYAREEYSRLLVFTECCGYSDWSAQYIRPYYDLLTAGGAMYGKERSFQHIVSYKLGVAAGGAPMVGWLGDTEAILSHYNIADLYSIYVAEGYANQSQLVGMPGRGQRAKYHDFIFGKPGVFDFGSWESEARVGLLYSLTTMADEDLYGRTHVLFFNIGQLLTDCHYQYDIVYSRGDDLAADRLAGYEVIILPQSHRFTATEEKVLLDFVQSGGSLVYIGETSDRSLLFADEENQPENITHTSEWVCISDTYCHHIQYQAMNNLNLGLPRYYQAPTEQPPVIDLEQTRAEFRDLIDSHLDKRVTTGTLGNSIGVVLWRNGARLNVHIINYDFDYATGQIREKTDLSLMIDGNLFPGLSRVTVLSPDFPEAVELPFDITDGFIHVTVPTLSVWDIIVME